MPTTLSKKQVAAYGLRGKSLRDVNEMVSMTMERNGEEVTFSMTRAEARALVDTVLDMRNEMWEGRPKMSPVHMALTNGALEKMGV